MVRWRWLKRSGRLRQEQGALPTCLPASAPLHCRLRGKLPLPRLRATPPLPSSRQRLGRGEHCRSNTAISIAALMTWRNFRVSTPSCSIPRAPERRSRSANWQHHRCSGLPMSAATLRPSPEMRIYWRQVVIVSIGRGPSASSAGRPMSNSRLHSLVRRYQPRQSCRILAPAWTVSPSRHSDASPNSGKRKRTMFDVHWMRLCRIRNAT